LIYIPTPAIQNKVEGPQPDAFGNFTDAAKQEALKIKDTANYWVAPEVNPNQPTSPQPPQNDQEWGNSNPQPNPLNYPDGANDPLAPPPEPPSIPC
jgi:hypothetical protein